MNSSRQGSDCEAVVIGAGPYGLSVGAHLKAAGVETLVFGDPMAFWRMCMPKGMRLRSPLRATSLSDPADALGLSAFALVRGAGLEEPLPLETFVEYGLWFEGGAAIDVDRRMVLRVSAAPDGFQLVLADGTTIRARRVIMAAGLKNQHVVPAAFAGLPASLASHTVAHADLSAFKGRRVGVVGRGQSALESAALLGENGAEVEVFSRGPIRWLGGASPSGRLGAGGSWIARTFAPPSAVGPFPLNWIAEWPGLTQSAPEAARTRFSERCLRAAAAGWLHARVQTVAMNEVGANLSASALGDRVVLTWEGGRSTFDHLLLATGYAIDVTKLGMLAPDLLVALARRGGAPLLSANFESSVPGLHFVGAAAVPSFGPLLRFIAGAGFAARRVTRAIANDRQTVRARQRGDRAGSAKEGTRAA